MHISSSVMILHLICFSILYTLTCADVCVKKSSCICEFSNGTGIDLSLAVKQTFYSSDIYDIKNSGAQYALSTYFYHPCFDALPAVNETAANNTCTSSLSLCRYVRTMNKVNTTEDTFKIDSKIYEFLGTSNNTEFSADGQSIIYHNGPSQLLEDVLSTYRSTVVLLVCAEVDGQLYIYSTMVPNKVVLSFYSRYACLRQIEEPGRSLGSTLLIIFFSCVVFYLVLGICTKKFLMGATGIEVIPNLAYWTDLPNLVKDGWAFVINGFKLPARGTGPVTSPDPNSYDSI